MGNKYRKLLEVSCTHLIRVDEQEVCVCVRVHVCESGTRTETILNGAIQCNMLRILDLHVTLMNLLLGRFETLHH